jgi:hypothetical protein
MCIHNKFESIYKNGLPPNKREELEAIQEKLRSAAQGFNDCSRKLSTVRELLKKVYEVIGKR